MDLLKIVRIGVFTALLGSPATLAEEEAPPAPADASAQETQQQSDDATATATPAQDSQTATQSASPNAQPKELKPLELKERIRAHANIDLPQDI